jgi:hypothetical protein
MYKFNVLLTFLIAVIIGFSACSKKTGADRIIGKWKAETSEQTQDTTMKVELIYEFTKDKMIAEGNVHGQELPKMEIPYVVKTNGDTVVLEATHPQSGAKGDFKITFEGEKMKLVDPDGAPMTLVKQ